MSLVDISETPIESITATGLRTTAADYELDAIVFATGFDAMTGSLLRMDVRGTGGVRLADAWADGPRTMLGLQVAGFPNLFTITGPGSPSVLMNMPVAIEYHVDWIADCIDYMREHGWSRIEATEEAQDAWVEHVAEVGQHSLFGRANSWYVGANIPGKPRVVMPYAGGQPSYRERCDRGQGLGVRRLRVRRSRTRPGACSLSSVVGRHRRGGVRRSTVLLSLVAVTAPVLAAHATAAAQTSQAAPATTSYTFVDSTRSTPCTGATDRALNVTVVTPGTTEPSPVVLVGPGSGASQRAVAKTDAAALAARGYVGVALDFPCTNAPGFSTTDPAVALDVYHQPADVSFVLTNLLSRSAAPGNALSGLLDPARVGLVGTSSGAVTGLLFFNTCCTDGRIRAMEIIKGFPLPTAAGLPVTGVYDWSRPIATYFWSGCLDVVTPHDAAASAFAQLGPPKAFVTDPTGTHDTAPVFPDGTPEAFLDRFVAGNTAAVTAAPFLAAGDDPYFAYDLGDSIDPHAATSGCAPRHRADRARAVVHRLRSRDRAPRTSSNQCENREARMDVPPPSTLGSSGSTCAALRREEADDLGERGGVLEHEEVAALVDVEGGTGDPRDDELAVGHRRDAVVAAAGHEGGAGDAAQAVDHVVVAAGGELLGQPPGLVGRVVRQLSLRRRCPRSSCRRGGRPATRG